MNTQEGENQDNRCWLEGLKAATVGAAKAECPYLGADADQWRDGYDTAIVTLKGDIQ